MGSDEAMGWALDGGSGDEMETVWALLLDGASVHVLGFVRVQEWAEQQWTTLEEEEGCFHGN